MFQFVLIFTIHDISKRIYDEKGTQGGDWTHDLWLIRPML